MEGCLPFYKKKKKPTKYYEGAAKNILSADQPSAYRVLSEVYEQKLNPEIIKDER